MLPLMRRVALCCQSSPGAFDANSASLTPRTPQRSKAAGGEEDTPKRKHLYMIDAQCETLDPFASSPGPSEPATSSSASEYLAVMEKTQRELQEAREALRRSQELLKETTCERDELARRVQLLRLVSTPVRVSRSDLATLGRVDSIKARVPLRRGYPQPAQDVINELRESRTPGSNPPSEGPPGLESAPGRSPESRRTVGSQGQTDGSPGSSVHGSPRRAASAPPPAPHAEPPPAAAAGRPPSGRKPSEPTSGVGLAVVAEPAKA